MTMLRTCRADGCTTKTLGELCLDHEAERLPEPRSTSQLNRAQPRAHVTSTADSAKLEPTGVRLR
jgi:hypothetical protein